MKQIEENVLCLYCMGCNKLELIEFEGVMNCKNFVKGKDLKKYYNKLKEKNKWNVNIEK